MWYLHLSTLLIGAAVIFSGRLVPADEQLDHAFERAKQAIEEGEYDDALSLMDEAVEKSPKGAKYRGLRGAALILKGEYAKGEADLKAAIELNPGDEGKKYRPASDAKLSEDRLSHGRRQVEKMLRDRPGMSEHGEEAAFLRRWAERKFAGEDFDAPIDWDSTPPLHSDAEHLSAAEDHNAAILIAPNYTEGPHRGKPRSFEELWAAAVYELHNVSFSPEFVRIHEEAERGKLTKDEFVGGILKLELLAAERTRAFYVRQFLPFAAKKKLKTDPTHWFCEWWDSPDTVLESFTDKAEYPWYPYGREFDWITVHRHWHERQYENTLKQLQPMLAEKGYEFEQSDVQYWIGSCLLRLDKPAEALAAFNESIRLDPENAASYRGRSAVHKKLGDNAKAEADLARARKLDSE